MSEKKGNRRRVFQILVLIVSTIVILIITLFLAIWWLNKPKPVGRSGAAADSLASVMLRAVNDSAWQQIGVIAWDFDGRRQYLWDKKRQFARIQWKDVTVLLDLIKVNGVVFKSGQVVPKNSKEHQAFIQRAWKYWCNDSFWLNPVTKLYDDGVERSIVQLEDGRDALLITYTSGGVTPGDCYLWYIGPDGLPVAWEMWVKIIPVGGVTASWEKWVTLPGGAKIATLHHIYGFDLEIRNVQVGATTGDLIQEVEPFGLLKSNVD